MNDNNISIDLTTLIPPTNSPANQQTTKTKNGITKQKPFKTSNKAVSIKKFAEVYAKTGNGVKAVEEAYPDRNLTYGSKAVQATRMLKNANIVNHIEYQRNKLELIANRAVDRVEEHVESDDSNVSFNASKFVIEQVHGKAVQKSSSVNFNFTQHVGDKSKDYGL